VLPQTLPTIENFEFKSSGQSSRKKNACCSQKVKNILFVATLYDAFILENEDSFFEQFMGEIYQYSLFSLPRITGVIPNANIKQSNYCNWIFFIIFGL